MDHYERELFISCLPALDVRQRLALLTLRLDMNDMLDINPRDLFALIGGHLSASWSPVKAMEEYRSIHLWLEKSVMHGISFYPELDFPALLREIPDPPFRLMYAGHLPSDSERRVSVVGTRHPTPAGEKAAFTFALEACDAHCPVVSGFAQGIDQDAHRGALAAHGRTWAVLGCGLDCCYPIYPELRAAIIGHGGALISEYGPQEAPLAWHFPQRNRLISGLSPVLVVIEAPEHSGALITVDHALQQGREVIVHVQGLQGGAAGEGSAALVEDGATVVASYAEMAALLGDSSFIGRSVGQADVSYLNHGQRLQAEREGRLFRFHGSWFEFVG